MYVQLVSFKFIHKHVDECMYSGKNSLLAVSLSKTSVRKKLGTQSTCFVLLHKVHKLNHLSELALSVTIS